jgi:hypothetical protein
MGFSGSTIQNAIYIGQQPPEWPIGPEDWERAAGEKLDPGAFDYIAGGAGGESTMAANVAAFDRWRIRPRMLTGNAERDITVDVLGTRSAAPFFLAPIGVLSIAHDEAETGVAHAAAAAGVPMILSSAATHPLEQVAETGCPRWFQLYWVSDLDVSASFVARAEESSSRSTPSPSAGARAICVEPTCRSSGARAAASSSTTRSFETSWRSRPRRTSSPLPRRCSRRSRTSASPGTTSTGSARAHGCRSWSRAS